MRVRRFRPTEAGLEAGSVRRIETEGHGYLSGLALDADEQGRLLAAWSRFGDGDKNEAGLFAQLFDAQLEPAGDAFRVTAKSEGKQALAAATGSRRILHHADGRL